MPKAILLVVDSLGIGASADADKYSDQGANTLLHIAKACASEQCNHSRQGPLTLPILEQLGLGQACANSAGVPVPGFTQSAGSNSAWGFAEELSTGKDTPSGHWEMAGVPVLFDWGYFTRPEGSFPSSLLAALQDKAHLPGVLGNCHGSGTEMIERYANAHIETGMPICYTSGDSVFQIAAHEEHYGLDRLYQLCEYARELLDEYNIGRVIARPFVGDQTAGFTRTANRKDYSVPPPAPTILDKLQQSGGSVIGVGKISDIFAKQGICRNIKAAGTTKQIQATLEAFKQSDDRSLIFTNLVDFDTLYGHRRDIEGYARELEKLDALLPSLINELGPDDVLIISADHGCDPSWPGTDHTREHVPILVYGPSVKTANLGKRKTFADIAQFLCDFFQLTPMDFGDSFYHQIMR